MIDGKQIKPGTLPCGVASITAASGAINTTETVLKTLAVPVSLKVGDVFDVVLYGTCTSTVANLSTFTLRYGAAGTTSDLTIGIITCTAAASGTTIPFCVQMTLTVRAIGASGSLVMSASILNNGVTGLSNAAVVVATPAAVTADTTTAKILSIAYKSAAITTTSTFVQCVLSKRAA